MFAKQIERKQIKRFLFAVASALLFFAVQRQWIVLMQPPAYAVDLQHTITKKDIVFWHWQHTAWHQEKQSLVWSNDQSSNLCYLINSWLSFLFDEECTNKKITAETAMLSPNGQELFISFDQTLFDSQQSTCEKLHFIQGLLRTIAQINTIQQVHFLVHHAPMIDEHVDFTAGWHTVRR